MEYELIGEVGAARAERETPTEIAQEIEEAFTDNTAVAEGAESEKEM